MRASRAGGEEKRTKLNVYEYGKKKQHQPPFETRSFTSLPPLLTWLLSLHRNGVQNPCSCLHTQYTRTSGSHSFKQCFCHSCQSFCGVRTN
jgi:hypothetical protein